MTYTIKLEKQAIKFISKQPPKQKQRILAAIYRLPYAGDIKLLQGQTNAYRMRVGSYRVIYTIDHQVLLVDVVEVGNRGDIYK